MEANIRTLRGGGLNPALERYTEVGRLLTDEPGATAEDGVLFVRRLCSDVGIRGLEVLGLEEDAMPDMARKAARASSMRGNPVKLEHDELMNILRRAVAQESGRF